MNLVSLRVGRECTVEFGQMQWSMCSHIFQIAYDVLVAW